jgi:hypothetical protein
MPGNIPDSPVVGRSYCPSCEPNADPTLEVLDVRWCEMHIPSREGPDDSRVVSEAYLSGGTEAGGEENRRWCEFIHRGRIEPPKKQP